VQEPEIVEQEPELVSTESVPMSAPVPELITLITRLELARTALHANPPNVMLANAEVLNVIDALKTL